MTATAGADRPGPAGGVPGRRADGLDAASEPAPAQIVATSSGLVQGRRTGGVSSWLGVPFAAPPIGIDRFAPPHRAPGWIGVRAALSYGASAPQPGVVPLPGRLARFATSGQSEDCLTLNVWSPADRPGTARRPVLFWIHGGAFETGAGSFYAGDDLAELGDIVVVTINYRLGPLGFLDLRDLFDDDRFAPNVGLADQLAALRWVQENIAGFGGDPNRVTIAGESAGAGSVCALMVCDRARGLFHGAICQSGGLNLISDRDLAIEIADVFAGQVEVSRENRDDLFGMEPERLLAGMRATKRIRVEKFSTRPFFDGELLPAALTAAWDFDTDPVPLLSGTNRDEVTMFHTLRQKVMPMSRTVVVNAMTHQLGGARTDRILAAYPDDRAGLIQLGTDLGFELPSLEFAQAHGTRAPVWRYRFDYPSPLLFGRIGATHGLELWFLFDMTPARSRRMLLGRDTDEVQALSARMKAHWVNFVRAGDPGGGWRRYDTLDRNTMIFDVADHQRRDPGRERRLVWGPTTPRIP